MNTLNLQAKKQLVMKKIVNVRYLNEEEVNDLGWFSSSVVLKLDNGVFIFPSSDDEGNGPGALKTNDNNNYILPVIPTTKPMIEHWSAVAKKQLNNTVITSARYLNKEEIENLGWDNSGIICFLNNHNFFYVSCDDEGNGPGALFFSNNDILPVTSIL